MGSYDEQYDAVFMVLESEDGILVDDVQLMSEKLKSLKFVPVTLKCEDVLITGVVRADIAKELIGTPSNYAQYIKMAANELNGAVDRVTVHYRGEEDYSTLVLSGNSRIRRLNAFN